MLCMDGLGLIGFSLDPAAASLFLEVQNAGKSFEYQNILKYGAGETLEADEVDWLPTRYRCLPAWVTIAAYLLHDLLRYSS